MTRERDLLRRALEFLDYRKIGSDTLEKDIKTFLAAEPEADELHEVVEKLVKWNKDYPSTRVYGYGDIKQIAEEMEAINAQAIAALAKAKPAEPAIRKPMTEEEIKAEAQSEKFNRCDAIVFAVGVRFAEKHHGISGEDQ